MQKLTSMLACALALMLLLTTAALGEAAQVGKTAPDFTLTTLDGETFALSEHRGKVVYLNIWATWCPPCVMEIPDIQKLYETYGDKLDVIGASVDDSAQDVLTFVVQNALTYPVAMDAHFHLAGELYPTDVIPLSVFISPAGVVTAIHTGSMSYAEMEALFREALEK